MPAPQRVAVIGAGLAGLTAARALADAGAAVTVFEKSRGLGGRLATRRTSEGWVFDHGAPDVQESPLAPAFAAFLDRALAAGCAERAPGGWVGRPGMSALVAPLARGLDIRFGVECGPVAKASGGWSVGGETFDAAVCAAPAPQTATLCAAAPLVAEAARAAAMDPGWTLLAGWRRPPAPAVAAPFAMVAPSAATGGHAGAWIAHATLDWTRANLERERPDVARDLAAALAAGCGADPADLSFAQAHRWRYARVARSVGAPCVAQDGLVAAGDWLLGPLAAHAHASGLAAAAALA